MTPVRDFIEDNNPDGDAGDGGKLPRGDGSRVLDAALQFGDNSTCEISQQAIHGRDEAHG